MALGARLPEKSTVPSGRRGAGVVGGWYPPRPAGGADCANTEIELTRANPARIRRSEHERMEREESFILLLHLDRFAVKHAGVWFFTKHAGVIVNITPVDSGSLNSHLRGRILR
jgi:hypothetical protein